MDPFKQARKVVVSYHGHEWPVYPLKSRDWTIYRVFQRVNGKRQPKTFSTLKMAKAHALGVLKEAYGKGDCKVHLTDGEKLDWKSAVGILKAAGIRSSLETICRHYVDLVKVAGSATLLTDVVQSHAKRRANAVTPIKVPALRTAYLAALRKKGRSTRHIQAEESHTSQFITKANGIKTDQITRELLQNFIDHKKRVVPRTKENLLNSVTRVMSKG